MIKLKILRIKIPFLMNRNQRIKMIMDPKFNMTVKKSIIKIWLNKLES